MTRRSAPLGLFVVLSVLTAGLPARAIEPEADAAALMNKGDEALQRGEFREAARAYTEYYRSQPLDVRASGTGAFVIEEVANAYDKAWNAAQDTRDLEASRDVLNEFLADAQTVGGDAEAEYTATAREKLARVESLLEKYSRPAPEPGPRIEKVGPAPRTGQADALPPDEPPPKGSKTRPDAVGIALTVAGSGFFAAGVGMIVGGVVIPRQAEDKLDGRNDADGQEWLDGHERTGRALVISGSVIAAVGLGAAVWGAVRLVKRSKANEQARIRPTAGGLAIHF